jgi:peroxygenase
MLVWNEQFPTICSTGSTKNGWAQDHKHMSVLGRIDASINHARLLPALSEQHCSFFDRDGDGVIWPIDTLIAFWELG